MSSSMGSTDCPKCGGSACIEQDNETLETHVHCTEPDCDYDSDNDDDYDNDNE